MEKTLRVLNELSKNGVIEQYALGGAFALLFYAEPTLTYDLDVFVFLPESQHPSKHLVVLSPIYQHLAKKGYKPDKEHVLIAGVPVQFIPAYNALVEEAVREACEKKYKGIKIRVVTLEHLLAIMLDTGRPKDKARIHQVVDEAKWNAKKLKAILERHHLEKKWGALVEKA